LCMGVLAQRLHLAASKTKSGTGIKICPRAEKIPCLLFTDDSLICCKSNLETCLKLLSILLQFCSQSEQLINFQRSALVFSKNATTTAKSFVAAVFSVPYRESLGKYLGCPIFQGKALPTSFFELLCKADSKLQIWKASSISKAGRAVLTQSNLESIPNHTMQCFKLSKSTSNNLDRINRDSFGKSRTHKKSLPMAS